MDTTRLREKIALEIHDWHCPDEAGVEGTWWTGPRMQDYLDCADLVLSLFEPVELEGLREFEFTPELFKIALETAELKWQSDKVATMDKLVGQEMTNIVSRAVISKNQKGQLYRIRSEKE